MSEVHDLMVRGILQGPLVTLRGQEAKRPGGQLAEGFVGLGPRTRAALDLTQRVQIRAEAEAGKSPEADAQLVLIKSETGQRVLGVIRGNDGLIAIDPDSRTALGVTGVQPGRVVGDIVSLVRSTDVRLSDVIGGRSGASIPVLQMTREISDANPADLSAEYGRRTSGVYVFPKE